jgi:hypothetical protein
MYDIEKCSPNDLPDNTSGQLFGFIMIGCIIAVLLFLFVMLIIFIFNEPGSAVFVVPPMIAYFLFLFLSDAYSNKRTLSRLKEMSEERQGLSIGHFARSFDCRKVDTWIIRAVYDYIQECMSYRQTENFPLKADDNMFDSLKIDPEDFDYDIEELAEKIGRTSNNIENNPYYGKVITVRDLVNFFNNQPLPVPH